MYLILKARLAIVAVVERKWLEDIVFNSRSGKIVSFLPVSRGICSRASQFYHFSCVCLSLLSEARGLAKLRAVLGLLIPVINAAVLFLSGVLYGVPTLFSSSQCHL